MKYHVEKSIEINKNVNDVVPLVADFNNWVKWSPWNVLEPGCKMQYGGKPGEPTHSMEWEGEYIGSGKQTLVKVEGGQYDYDLEFLKPFKSKAKAGIKIEPVGQGTKVTWTLDASMPFFLFFLVSMMKNWMGMDYTRGLSMLKTVAESGKVPATTTIGGIVDREAFGYVGIRRTVSLSELATLMNQDFKTLMDAIAKHNVTAKHWVCLYPKMDIKNLHMTYIAAISDENLNGIDLGTQFVRGKVLPGRGVEIKHSGSYEFLGNAWSMGMMYMKAKKLKNSDVPYEYYWNDPSKTAVSDLKTSVFFPVR